MASTIRQREGETRSEFKARRKAANKRHQQRLRGKFIWKTHDSEGNQVRGTFRRDRNAWQSFLDTGWEDDDDAVATG